MTKELGQVKPPFMALRSQRPPAGLIHHLIDNGSTAHTITGSQEQFGLKNINVA